MKPTNDPGTVEAVTTPPRPFSHVLAMMEGGQLQNDASDAMRDLCSALSEHDAQQGKAKGTLTIVLDVKMEGGIVEIVGDVKVKAPKLKREKSIFWLTPANDLSQENPKQLTMGLRSAPAQTEAPRDVTPAPAAVKKI